MPLPPRRRLLEDRRVLGAPVIVAFAGMFGLPLRQGLEYAIVNMIGILAMIAIIVRGK